MTRTRTRPGACRLYGPAAAAGHAGVWLLWPRPAILITVLDVALAVTALTVIATALYAPDHISDRAFQLLPWTTKPAAADNQPGQSPDWPSDYRDARARGSGTAGGRGGSAD